MNSLCCVGLLAMARGRFVAEIKPADREPDCAIRDDGLSRDGQLHQSRAPSTSADNNKQKSIPASPVASAGELFAAQPGAIRNLALICAPAAAAATSMALSTGRSAKISQLKPKVHTLRPGRDQF